MKRSFKSAASALALALALAVASPAKAVSTVDTTLSTTVYGDLGAGPIVLGASGGNVFYQIADAQPPAGTPAFVVRPGDPPVVVPTTSHIWALGSTASTIAIVAPYTAAGGGGGGGGPATQSGVWNIANITGTITLPTNAATAANQTAVQAAPGSSAASAEGVQGVTGGLAIAVSKAVGAGAFATAQVATSSSATLLAAARTGAPGTGRVAITVFNNGLVEEWIGVSGVTTSTGIDLKPGASRTLDVTAAVYAITAGAAGSADVVETF